MNDTIQQLQLQIAALKQKLGDARRAATPEPVEDHTLQNAAGPVRLSELFGGRDELLVIHNMGKTCPYCTLWADGLNGMAHHLLDRAACVVASPDPPDVQAAFVAGRGWRLPMVSYGAGTFALDMGFRHADHPDAYEPGVSAFRKQADGSIVRTGRDGFGPGDDYCAAWPLFELFGELEGQGWAPKTQMPGGGCCGG